jgi:hypothetical protein
MRSKKGRLHLKEKIKRISAIKTENVNHSIEPTP